MMQDQLFNEYYFELLKKLKVAAREKKNDSHDARVILRAIKKHYSSYDKLSEKFRAYVNQHADVWDSYDEVASDIDQLNAWLDSHADSQLLYEEVPLSTMIPHLGERIVLHHFMTLVSLFRKDMSPDDINIIVDNLKATDETVVIQVDNDKIVNLISRVKYLRTKYTEHAVKEQINGIPDIESTSLGKLAKEIMDEMNIDELQSSLGNGDIMQALANPDGGLVKLLGTVSQKMISKMSSGEIKQENLLQDAMKLASQIGGKEMGMLGNMASLFSGMGGGDDGGAAGLGDITKMMSAMMGNAPGMNKQAKVRPNTSNLKKMSKKHELRQKLEKRRAEAQQE